MSDYYDSLEDECDENKCSSDSSKEQETPLADFVTAVSENESTENYSFYLGRSVSEEKIKILPNLQVRKTPKSYSEKKNFLPEIGNCVNENGAESVRSLFVDKQILSKQGLKLNNDGSFTKSPRMGTEELPFIAEKYKNLQFQRKSMYKVDKKCFKKVQKKTMFSFTKKPIHEVSMNDIINARTEKGSNEEMLLTSRGSSVSVINHSKTDEQLPLNDNLTDSMKEKLLQSQRETPLRALKISSNLKKTKHELNLIKNCEIPQRNKFLRNIKGGIDRDEAKNVFFRERCMKSSSFRNNSNKKHKSTDSKIFKFQSDILSRTTARPKLNYSELRMLKNGYNPMFLRHWSKKVQSDTNRSNFGDSVVEEFPEVSNSATNSENLAHDESEEIFYRNLIEKDISQKQQIQLSTRSESPLEGKKLREKDGSKSYREQTEMSRSGKGNFRRKHISKSLYIDLPPEVDYSVNTLQKSSHFCSADSSRNVSKVELALKAKTYGYLANARNIFKLKNQSERRSISTEKNENLKIGEKLSMTNKIVYLSQGKDKASKHNSSSLNVFPSVEEESFKILEKLPRATKSSCGIKCLKVTKEREEGFVLPPVNSPEVRNTQKKILTRMSSCLKTSNG